MVRDISFIDAKAPGGRRRKFLRETGCPKQRTRLLTRMYLRIGRTADRVPDVRTMQQNETERGNDMANMTRSDVLADPQFQHPYIDVDEWRQEPVAHHYIHGGFEGTETRFCFYYPKKADYKGRFFQPVSPFVGDEKESQAQTGVENNISMAILHGAYLVESNLGGIVNGGNDPSLMYRACAACAEFSRKLAREYYGEHRPYGYVYGGSGGGYKTISCVESTSGIWDGAVPFVIGSPVSLPNLLTIRTHAMRLLRDKMDVIKDALEPGGSGDPYAGLDEEEKAALREAELMGFPMKAWTVYETLDEGSLPVLAPIVKQMDPEYVRDFWEKPGYLGYDPDGSAARDRIVHKAEIVRIIHNKEKVSTIADTIDEGNAYGVDEAWKHLLAKGQKVPVFALDSWPEGKEGHSFYSMGLTIHFETGALAGEVFDAIPLPGNCVTVNPGMDQRDMEEILAKAAVGDRIVLDNSDYIAMQTYHRHQVPGREYLPWDQYRDENGDPIYPQRAFLTGPLITQGGAGSVQQGTPTCKVIVLESLMDESAFPWQADWYRKEVIRHLAPGTDGESVMRLWFMENCMHTDCDNAGDHQHIVSYLGALMQALLDLSDWVERGIEPPHTTGYTMDGGNVLVAETARERKGFQPVVTLTVDGKDQKTIRTGERVMLNAQALIPEGSGQVDLVLWDFESTDEFLPGGAVLDETPEKMEIENSHVFRKSGTYFPVVKIALNRNPGDVLTRVWNLARVRIIVEDE